MNKLSRIIEDLSEEDIMKIRRDLIAGNIDRLINKRLDQIKGFKFNDRLCPVCSGEISESAFVLEFGESYLRRRAFFDGIDCLDYFLHNQLHHKKDPDKVELR